jgi:protein TonB
MEVKKTPKADLESERITFFLMGLVVILSTIFVLLEWQSEVTFSPDWEKVSELFIEEERIEKKEPIVFSKPVETKEKKTESKPNITYEGFHIVKDSAVINDSTSQWLNEIDDTKEKDILSSVEIQKMIDDIVYADPETMPQYQGGYSELNRFIFRNIKYPPSATSQKIQGRVWCSFIVNKDGSISDIQIEKGVFISLDQESLRVLALMPKWIPGTVRGKPVRVKIYLPIVFRL